MIHTSIDRYILLYKWSMNKWRNNYFNNIFPFCISRTDSYVRAKFIFDESCNDIYRDTTSLRGNSLTISINSCCLSTC